MLNILVVDDDEAISTMLIDMVNCLGSKGTKTGRIETAVEMFYNQQSEENHFDAIIMDLNLDGLNRAEDWVQRFQGCIYPPHLILITGSGDDKVAKNHIRYGFSHVLAKPFSYKMLAGILDELSISDSS